MPRDVAKFPGPFIAPIRTTPSTGGAHNLQQAASIFQQLAGSAHKRQDLEKISLARTEAARLVAETGKPVQSPQGGLYGEAFNASMHQAYGNVVQLRLREKAHETAQKHPNDPVKLNTELTEWAKGFRKEIPAEMRTGFDLMRQQISQPLISTAQANAFKIAQDGAKANLLALRSNIYRHIDTVAPGLFSGDPLQTQQSFDTISLEWEALEGQYNQIGPNGLPLFSQEEKMEKRIEFFDRVYDSGLRGWVDASPDKIKAFQQLLTGQVTFELNELSEDGKTITGKTFTVDPAQQMTREKRTKVLGYAQSQMNAYISAMNRLETRAEKELEKRQELMGSEAMRRMIDNDPTRPLSRLWLDANEANLDDNDYQAMIKAVEEGPEISDPDAILQIEDMMEQGQDAWPDIRREWMAGELTKPHFFSLRSRNAGLMKDRSPTNPYRRVIDYLETSFGTRSPLDKWNPIQMIGAQARVDFDRWWDKESADGEPPGFNEAFDQAQRLLVHRLPPHKLKNFLNSFISKPERKYLEFDKTDPSVIDTKATAVKIFKQFHVEPSSENMTWPPELIRQLQLLDEYQAGYDRYLELKGAQDATVGTIK